MIRRVELNQSRVSHGRPGGPGRGAADRGCAQGIGILNDPLRIGLEQVAAPQHRQHPAGVPVQPGLGPIQLGRRSQRRNRGIHPLEVHGVDEVTPFQQRAGVVGEQGRARGEIGVGPGQRDVVDAEGLDRLQPSLGQGLRRGHADSVEVGLAAPDQGPADVLHHPYVGLADGAGPRLHHRGDPVIEQVDQALQQLGAGGVVADGIGAHGHHRPHHRLVRLLRTSPGARTVLEGAQLIGLEPGLVLWRHRVAGEGDGLAAVPAAAVEQIDRDVLCRSFKDQAVGVPGAGLRFRPDLHLGPVAGDVDELVEGQVAAGQDHGPGRGAWGDGVIRLSLSAKGQAPAHGHDGEGRRQFAPAPPYRLHPPSPAADGLTVARDRRRWAPKGSARPAAWAPRRDRSSRRDWPS